MELPWSCPGCGQGFTTEVGLRKHALRAHDSRYHRERRTTFQNLHRQLYAVASRHLDLEALDVVGPWPDLDASSAIPAVDEIQEPSDVDVVAEGDFLADEDPYL